jgi:uncharacterized protein YecT (DUF1311 family)
MAGARSVAALAAVILIAMSSAAPADEPELDCENPMTTMDRELCADRTAGVADAELNTAYLRARARLDRKRRDLLLDAQRAWLAFRDKQCNAVLVMMEGSGRNAAYLECRIGLAKTRTRDLREMAAP